MRITILQGAFLPVPPLLGGAVEKQWFELGKAFAARGHEVEHISRTFPGLPSEEVICGVRHVRIPGSSGAGSGLRQKLFDLLYTLRAAQAAPPSDIIVTNTFWAPFVLPLVHRGCVYVDFSRAPKGQHRWYPRSVKIRAPSEATARLLVESSPAARGVTRVIPYPLPFEPGPVEFDQKSRSILYAGRIHPEKGLDILLAAFLRLKAARPESGWTLDLVGPWKNAEGGGGEDFKNSLEEKFKDPAVTWHGRAENSEVLSAFYKTASIFCYPSIAEHGESFGLAPLEAMAWGCVPLVSMLECFQDFIRQENNGIVFDHRTKDPVESLRQGLVSLTEDEALRKRLGRAAMNVRETHSTSRIAGLFLADFESCLGQIPVNRVPNE